MKTGDYVRLDRFQGINRIDEYDEYTKKYSLECCIYDEWGDETFLLDEEDVIKSSPNIIDLIEEGDYVDKNKVMKINKEKQIITIGGINGILDIHSNQIKSIVTREQFESMEYTVE